MLVITLCPLPIGLDSRPGQRLHPAQSGTQLAGAEFRDLDRVEAGLDEGAGDVGGECLGAPIGPDEVVADGVGDIVFHLGADLGPVLRSGRSCR